MLPTQKPEAPKTGVPPVLYQIHEERRVWYPYPGKASRGADHGLAKKRAFWTETNQHYEAGSHIVVWNGRDDADRTLPSGAYFAQIKVGSVRMVERMTLLK